MGLLSQPLQHRCGHARLADPGLAGQQNDLTFAGFRPRPAAHQEFEFLVPANQRHAAGAQCFEAAEHAALADHAPSVLRFCEAGERLRTEVGQVEQPADLAAGGVGDDDCIGVGQTLNTGRQIRGFPHDAAFLGRADADQVADHREASSDADPHL